MTPWLTGPVSGVAVGGDDAVGVVVAGWLGETCCAGAPWFAIEAGAEEVPELVPERKGLDLNLTLGAALAVGVLGGTGGEIAALGCSGAAAVAGT